jgi:hypothetical protein
MNIQSTAVPPNRIFRLLRNILLSVAVPLCFWGIYSAYHQKSICALLPSSEVILPPPIPTIASSIQTLWGQQGWNPIITNKLSENRYIFFYSASEDGKILAGLESSCSGTGTKTVIWVVAYNVDTHTLHRLYDISAPGDPYVNPLVTTDGHFVAWYKTNGYDEDQVLYPSVVGYANLQTGKQTILHQSETVVPHEILAIDKGKLFWGKQDQLYTVDLNNGKTIASLQTKGIIDTTKLLQRATVSWPYLIFQQDSVPIRIYNFQTAKSIDIAPDLSSRNIGGLWIDTAQHVYWENRITSQIYEIDDLATYPKSEQVIMTISGTDILKVRGTDRLFIWNNGSDVFAWDRIQQRSTRLTYHPNFADIAFDPLVFGQNMLILYDGIYVMVNTDTLPRS